LKIDGRTADDLEHVAGRGLVFERLFKIGGTLAQFSGEPRVFHHDDRLRGEILQQRDLFLREGPDLLAIDKKIAEQFGALCSATQIAVRASNSSASRRRP
jgi:hypothetical protein